MHVEPDGDEELLGAVWWDGLPLARAPRMRREAVQIYELLLVAGVSPGDADGGDHRALLASPRHGSCRGSPEHEPARGSYVRFEEGREWYVV